MAVMAVPVPLIHQLSDFCSSTGWNGNTEVGEKAACRVGPTDRVLDQVVVASNQQGEAAGVLEKQAHVPFPEGYSELHGKTVPEPKRVGHIDWVPKDEDAGQWPIECPPPERQGHAVAGILPYPWARGIHPIELVGGRLG